MKCLRSLENAASPSIPETLHKKQLRFVAIAICILSTSISVTAQDPPASQQPGTKEGSSQKTVVTIPAGTQVALVLTHPIQSRYIRRGDDIYAQTTAPVLSGNEMVIPPGTFVQGTVDKLGHQGDRGELHLQSVTITFADGYVAPISGPLTVETNEGYAIKDPGSKRGVAALALPAAGAGLGALIGHSVGKADSTVTSPFPPGCVGAPPFCTTVSTPVFGTKTKDAIIGAGIGSAIGAVASITMLFSSHHFYIDAGAPVEMTLEHPVALDRTEVEAAVQQSTMQPAFQPVILPRPVAPPPPVDNTPAISPTPGMPPTVIPGPPGPDGTPGPPIVIPGTPPGGGVE